MAEAWRLRSQDYRAVTRLMAECCEIGPDPYAYFPHIFECLKSHVGIKIATAGMCKAPLKEMNVKNLCGVIDSGFPCAADFKLAASFWMSGAYQTDELFVSMTTEKSDVVQSCRRQDRVDNTTWYNSVTWNEFYHDLRVDHMMSTVLMSPLPGSGIGSCFLNLFRNPGESPFSERDRRVVLLIINKLRNLLGDKLMAFGPSNPPGLSPRLCQVKALLVRGYTEKEVANQFNLSIHTVHDYVKELHKKLDVHCRGELLKRTENTYPPEVPTLSLFPKLSPREAQVLELLLMGHTEKEVAEQLRLSPNTTHDYMKSLHRHFNAGTHLELLFKARLGMADRSDNP